MSQLKTNRDAGSSSEERIRLKVCSYNIHKGFSAGNRRFLIEQIRRAIRLIDADLVFLQEVVGHNRFHIPLMVDWDVETQFEFLADSVWPHYAYGKNAIYDHGHHGNAILSKYPLSQWTNFDLSCVPLSNRGVLHGVILDNVHLFCVHLGFFDGEQKTQLRSLAQFIAQTAGENDPVIVAGDFNDWPRRANRYLAEQLDLQEVFVEQQGKSVATFPSIMPFLPMDRIYFRGLDLLDAQSLTGQPWRTLSDHCALYAEFISTSE